ncbi:MAG TPA: Gfo/Idh/MocA family oxidoreductase [bacterium]|nr:Gfo/Idh/MocA family oxidoreductase [bacterium]HPP00402.1 Gfo/Idh/MocA family oxidoreductase [bacterium]HXK94341.1 Gfo/Idh/MocA family oxidoreductase [bacterium]
MKRRDFHRTALAMGAWSLTAAQATSVQGANDRIRVAVIGCGVRGSQHIADILACREMGVEISHVCDVWRGARETAVAAVKKGQNAPVHAVEDYRVILAHPEVNAVTIATPDFSHAKILKEAAEAGKDAYCEKPMAVDLQEALAAVDAVRANQRVVQSGTQYRSDGHFIACASAVHSGVLGLITRIAIAQNFNEPRWRKAYDDVREDDVNWPLFELHHGPHPFSAKKFRRWYLYRDYTNGLPGLWMSHYLNAVAWFMQDLFPAEVVCSAAVRRWGDDGRETEDTLSAILDYPSGFQLNFSMSLCNSADTHFILYGSNGKLDVWKRELSGDGGGGPDQIKETRVLPPENPPNSHMADFLDCVRTRQDPRCPVEMGLAHSVAGILCAESNRLGKRLRYNPEKREIV